MAVGHQGHGCVAMPAAAMLAGTVHQPVNLALGEIAPFNCQVYDAWCAFLGCRFHADKPCLRATYCLGYARCLHSRRGAAAWSASESQRRMEAPGRANLILSCHRTSMWPPVGGTFWFQIFIQAPSLEIWRKTISGAEGGCWRSKWDGLFWATSLEKIIGGVIAIISCPGGWMQQSAVPR